MEWHGVTPSRSSNTVPGTKSDLAITIREVTLSLADKNPANLGISFLLCLVLINAPICIANNHYTPENALQLLYLTYVAVVVGLVVPGKYPSRLAMIARLSSGDVGETQNK